MCVKWQSLVKLNFKKISMLNTFSHKIQSFEISSGPLNIEAVKASDSYTLTIEQIHFKVSAEFKYKVNL